MKRSREFPIDLTEAFPHLASAPIVEAVIQWVAAPDAPIAGDKLLAELTERLPDYPDRKPQHEFTVEAKLNVGEHSTQSTETWQGFCLTQPGGRNVVQFLRHGLVVSRLRPYESWKVFSAEALRIWSIYRDLARPSAIQRLGVRFINRIAPVEPSEVAGYLARAPKCLEPMGLPMTGFLYQSAHSVPGYAFRVNVVATLQSSVPAKGEGTGLILDIDVTTTQALEPSQEVVLDRLTKMRWLKNKAFFTMLKSKVIESLK
jgi:uncharacterized protein (TIGR04255 family)